MIQVELNEGINVVTCKFSFSGKAGGTAYRPSSVNPNVKLGMEQHASLSLTYLKKDDQTAERLKECVEQVLGFDDEREYAINRTRFAVPYNFYSDEYKCAPRYHTTKSCMSTHHEVLQGLFRNMHNATLGEDENAERDLLLTDTFADDMRSIIPAVFYQFYELNSYSETGYIFTNVSRLDVDNPKIHDGMHICGAHYDKGQPIDVDGINWWMIDFYEDKKNILSGAIQYRNGSELGWNNSDFLNLKREIEKVPMNDLINRNTPTDFLVPDESYYTMPSFRWWFR